MHSIKETSGFGATVNISAGENYARLKIADSICFFIRFRPKLKSYEMF